ncbi:MAG: hypothetical protein PHS60_02210 [Zavarzinia sp.]|nr:hypothetical protein [Zavarzinia sp.]
MSKETKQLENAARILPIDLTAAFADREIHCEGSVMAGWLGPTAATEVWIRFNGPTEQLIPFRQGMSLEIPFDRIYVTNLVPVAPPANILYLLYGDRETVRVQNNAADPGAVLGGMLAVLTAMQGDTAAILAATTAGDTVRSTGGESEVVNVGAGAAANGAAQACRQAYIWTAGATIHWKIGATDADAGDPILPANVMYPVDVADTELLRFYNSGGGAIDVAIVWRN